jgi:hypothetical protein
MFCNLIWFSWPISCILCWIFFSCSKVTAQWEVDSSNLCCSYITASAYASFADWCLSLNLTISDCWSEICCLRVLISDTWIWLLSPYWLYCSSSLFFSSYRWVIYVSSSYFNFANYSSSWTFSDCIESLDWLNYSFAVFIIEILEKESFKADSKTDKTLSTFCSSPDSVYGFSDYCDGI